MPSSSGKGSHMPGEVSTPANLESYLAKSKTVESLRQCVETVQTNVTEMQSEVGGLKGSVSQGFKNLGGHESW
eukprot:9177764-Karenia_brevis.AAC.1